MANGQDREESSARVQPLTAHPRQLVNGAGPGREVSPGTVSDSTPMTPGKRSRVGERDTASGSTFTRPGEGAGLGREFIPDTASDSTPNTTGEWNGAGERVQPGYSL